MPSRSETFSFVSNVITCCVKMDCAILSLVFVLPLPHLICLLVQPRIFAYGLCSLCCPAWCCFNHLDSETDEENSGGERVLSEEQYETEHLSLLRDQTLGNRPASHQALSSASNTESLASPSDNLNDFRQGRDFTKYALYPPGRILHITEVDEKNRYAICNAVSYLFQ